jgi:hypothetical protein
VPDKDAVPLEIGSAAGDPIALSYTTLSLSDENELDRMEASREVGEDEGLGAIKVLENPLLCHES